MTGGLSSGQLTRLNLCKALLNDPEVLFLDEPTASLDPEMADRMRQTLRELQAERGVTIVYTSHNMQEVERLCDRVAVPLARPRGGRGHAPRGDGARAPGEPRGRVHPHRPRRPPPGRRGRTPMVLSRIAGLLLRYGYLYRRSLARSMELFFWPLMDLLVWGFLTRYLEGIAAPRAVSYLVGALILWDVLYRCQQAITLAITEDIWVKNILNLFVTPVRPSELLLATSIVGVVKAAAPCVLLTVLAFVLLRVRPHPPRARTGAVPRRACCSSAGRSGCSRRRSSCASARRRRRWCGACRS